MRVHVIKDADAHVGIMRWRELDPAAVPSYSGWRPKTVLGATSAGGLLLPDAQPSASTMYAPRGVWVDDERVIAADTGNHRVLIWHGRPQETGVPADVVLGQQDDHTEGPNAGGAGPENGMHLPTGLLVDADGRLILGDAWNHRILVWDRVPDRTGTPPDHVIGQPDLASIEPNAGGEPTAATFYWPFNIVVIDGRFYVCDTGNRRVLIWNDGVPLDGRPADVVLGQPDAQSRRENRGAAPAADSFRWPHAVAPTGRGGVVIADAGNHRLLIWREHPDRDRPADAVVAQPDFENATELPYQSQVGRLRFPYAAVGGPGLAVADTANNRVLMWNTAPDGDEPADFVLAQPDFRSVGENRWDVVGPDTLCWPYGLCRHGSTLGIADSGNNRIVLWEQDPVEGGE